MAGKVSSLNVSVAGAVVLYEAARQRRVAADRAAALAAPAPVAAPRRQKGLGSFASEADFASAEEIVTGSDSAKSRPPRVAKPKPRGPKR